MGQGRHTLRSISDTFTPKTEKKQFHASNTSNNIKRSNLVAGKILRPILLSRSE